MREASIRDLTATHQVQVGEACEGLEMLQASIRDLLAMAQVQLVETADNSGQGRGFHMVSR